MDNLISIQGITYECVNEERNGWNPEAFKARFSEVLGKYDFIVGDWGYGQLRLKGFYEDNNKKVPFDQKIGSIDEYIQEYCNFGCAYFVLKKVKQSSNIHLDQEHDHVEEEI